MVEFAPIYDRAFTVNQPFFIHFDEKFLLKFGIKRIGSRKFALFRKAKPQRLKLAAHIIDIFVGPNFRMYFVLYRSVFGRHTEAIKADRMKDVVAALAVVASQRVADGVVSNVPHMDASARIWKHT